MNNTGVYSCSRPGDNSTNYLEYVTIDVVPKGTLLYLPSSPHLKPNDPIPFSVDPNIYPIDTFDTVTYETTEDLLIAVGAPDYKSLEGICYSEPDECYSTSMEEINHPQGWKIGPFIYLCYADFVKNLPTV